MAKPKNTNTVTQTQEKEMKNQRKHVSFEPFDPADAYDEDGHLIEIPFTPDWDEILQNQSEQTLEKFDGVVIPTDNKFLNYSVENEEIMIRRKDVSCAILRKEADGKYTSILILENGTTLTLNTQAHFKLFKTLTPYTNAQEFVDKICLEKE
ncbi:MAG: hypothetical protein SNJ71_01270 [Bacteroidales bacterium]